MKTIKLVNNLNPIDFGVLLNDSRRFFKKMIGKFNFLKKYQSKIEALQSDMKFWRESADFWQVASKRKDERLEESEKAFQELQNKLHQCEKRMLHLPYEFDYKRIMKEMADAAWYGGINQKQYTSVIDRSLQIVFVGHTYEQSYEDFTAGCDVIIENQGVRHTVYSIDGKNVEAYRYKVIEKGSIDDIPAVLVQMFSAGFVEIDS